MSQAQKLITIKTCLQQATSLQAVSDSPKLDVELLLCHAINQSRTFLYTWPEAELSAHELETFQGYLQRRISGEPIAHIIGKKEFWSLDLSVNSSTLIPRPETELLVETGLELLADEPHKVLDLGTGSGAIALALAKERPTWQITAIDKSLDAIQLAKHNQHELNIANVSFLHSDWFNNLNGEKFDLIVANPPYVDERDPHLRQGDVQFEPQSALVSAAQGLADIEQIVARAGSFLNGGGWLLTEHGYTQGETVRAMFQQYGYSEVATRCDLANLPRMTQGRCAASIHRAP